MHLQDLCHKACCWEANNCDRFLHMQYVCLLLTCTKYQGSLEQTAWCEHDKVQKNIQVLFGPERVHEPETRKQLVNFGSLGCNPLNRSVCMFV